MTTDEAKSNEDDLLSERMALLFPCLCALERLTVHLS